MTMDIALEPPRPSRLNWPLLFGLLLIAAIVLPALAALVWTPYGAATGTPLADPDAAHWLGTDSFGRDMLSRVIYGARISFLVGFSSVGIAMVLGVAIGLLAGYFGGVADAVLMRVVDGLLSFTPLVLAIAFIAVLGLGLQNVVLALAATFTGMFARVTRADVINMKAEPFVEAAQLLGVSHAGVIARHILPNVLSPIIVQFGLNLAVAILLESGLSFLGLGVTPPAPDLGLMIA